jgi:hypothetical protein
MPANVNALVKEGIALFKSGKRMEAKQALLKAVEINDQDEQAWLWLSALVDSPEERLTCLENVLRFNPNNMNARRGLEETQRELAAKRSTQAPAADPWGASAGFSDPFAGTGFDANPYGKTQQTSDPALSGWSGFDVPASSVEWGQPAAPSAPSAPSAGEPTSADYDNWMAGLSINQGGSSAFGDPFGGSGGFGGSDPFGGGGSGFNFGNADFGGGTSNTPAFSPDSFDDSYNAYNSYDAAPAAPGQTSAGAFGDFSFDEPLPADTFGATGDDPFNLGRNKSQFDFGTDDVFDQSTGFDTSPAPATMPVVQDDFTSVNDFPSPSFDDDVPAATPSSGGYSFRSQPPALSTPKSDVIKPVEMMSASVFTTIDSAPSLANPSVYFNQIPDEIQAGGTMRALRKRATATTSLSNLDIRLVIIVVVLLVLNIGSLIFLLSNLRQ